VFETRASHVLGMEGLVISTVTGNICGTSTMFLKDDSTVPLNASFSARSMAGYSLSDMENATLRFRGLWSLWSNITTQGEELGGFSGHSSKGIQSCSSVIKSEF